jgi:hypothetical protein
MERGMPQMWAMIAAVPGDDGLWTRC